MYSFTSRHPANQTTASSHKGKLWASLVWGHHSDRRRYRDLSYKIQPQITININGDKANISNTAPLQRLHRHRSVTSLKSNDAIRFPDRKSVWSSPSNWWTKDYTWAANTTRGRAESKTLKQRPTRRLTWLTSPYHHHRSSSLLYQTSQGFPVFMGVPFGQLKWRLKSGELARVPMTLYLGGLWGSVTRPSWALSGVRTEHHTWKRER